MKKEVLLVILLVLLAVVVGFIGFKFGRSSAESGAASHIDEPELPELSAHAEDDGLEIVAGAEVAESAEIEESVEYATEVPAEADSADVPEDVTLVDSYGMYIADENWLSACNGFAIERNGSLYSLGGTMEAFMIDQYNIGYEIGARGSDVAYSYLYDFGDVRDVPTEAVKGIISAGDFPILQVAKDEQIRVYSQKPLDTVTFTKTDFYGYTIFANQHADIYSPVLDHTLAKNQINGNNVGVFDLTDNPVEDVRNLEYGRDYKYEWYTGTEYHEMVLPANCRCYLEPDDGATKYELPVEMTKSGYATIDISSLEPGFYTISDSMENVFEIVE